MNNVSQNLYMHKLCAILKMFFQTNWNITNNIDNFCKKKYERPAKDFFFAILDNFSQLSNITLCIFSYDFLFDLYWGQGGLRDQFWFLVKFRHVGVRLTFDVDQKLNVVMICEKIEHLWSLRCNIYAVQNITIMKFKIYLRY